MPVAPHSAGYKGPAPGPAKEMFAVIKTGGKQYKVAADDVIKVEKLEGEAGDTVTFENVLMVGNGGDVTVGAPLVDGALVAAELVETKKQKTVIIFKKNRRHGYRRRNGHRQLLSTVKITEILTGGKKPSAKKAAAPKAAPKEEVKNKPAAKAAPKKPAAKAAEAKAAPAEKKAAPAEKKAAPKKAAAPKAAAAKKPAAKKPAAKAAAKPKAEKK